MRIMIDTNVLISIIFFPSSSMNELKTMICEKHTIVLCSHIIEELNRVVNRKFVHKSKDLDVFLTELPYELVYTPAYIEKGIYQEIRDVADYPILITAITADIDVLLTGDKDFTTIAIDHPEIMTPAKFIKKYK